MTLDPKQVADPGFSSSEVKRASLRSAPSAMTFTNVDEFIVSLLDTIQASEEYQLVFTGVPTSWVEPVLKAIEQHRSRLP